MYKIKITGILISLICGCLWPQLLLGQTEKEKVYAKRDSLKDWERPVDRELRIWVEMRLGPSTFTQRGSGSGGLGLNIAKDHHLFGFDWQDHYPAIDEDVITPCTKTAALTHYNFYYGYWNSKNVKFWYGKTGLSIIRKGEYDGIPTTVCDRGSYSIRYLGGVPVEVGYGWKLPFVAFQFYASGLFFKENAVGSAGFKVALGAF